MNPLRAVVFDLWGTLVPNIAPGARDAVSRDMALDLGVDPEEFARAYRDSYRERFSGASGTLEETIQRLARGCGGEPGLAAVDRAARRRLELTRRALAPPSATLSVLDALLARGLRLALVSDSSVETVALWPSTPLAPRIPVTAFSCLLGVRKPDPALYLHAVHGLALSPGDCLFVGDGGGGELSGAEALGMTAVKLVVPGEPDGVRYEEDLTFAGRCVASLQALLDPRLTSFFTPS